MKRSNLHKRRDPEGKDSPLGILLVVLINLVAILVVAAPLFAAQKVC